MSYSKVYTDGIVSFKNPVNHAKTQKKRTYFCIDMKSFFASVECAERGLNPFEANLVVADESRGNGAICLAVSPKMKSLGVKNRCRLFEIPPSIQYITAKPRMKKYIEYCADIYDIYLDYVSPDDIHVYSIDECFIDATDYLSCYKLGAEEFAIKLVDEISLKLHIPASAGIGTNLYLAKIALDITAKHTLGNIGILNEKSFIRTLWKHRPITDFWGISSGTAKRLDKYGIYDMAGIARAPEELMYRVFGVNAELLVDHAFGRESCTMQDIKSYKSKRRSISNSQILFSDYTYEKALTVMKEMALTACQTLLREKKVTDCVSIFVGYSKNALPSSGKMLRMTEKTNVYSVILKYVIRAFEESTDKNTPIRRLGICYANLQDECMEVYDLFTDVKSVEKERHLEYAVLDIKEKFGKNAVLRGTDLKDEATTKERNKLIGGHNGG